MLKRYFLNNKKRNFSVASIWIKGGSDMDSVGKKGINKILSSLITRGCEGFNNFALSEYIESYGAELNQEVFEDGISISIKSLNEHFSKLFPLLELIINKPTLLEIEFQKVKKSSINLIKKEKRIHLISVLKTGEELFTQITLMLLIRMAMQMMSQRLPMKMFCLSLKI